jgi:hypothetical protein
MRWLALSLSVVLAGSAALAQVVFTLNDLDKAMKGIGRHVVLLNAAIASKDFEVAKERVARARELLTPTVNFWRNEKKVDAQSMVRVATARLDDLDALLSASLVNESAVAAAASSVETACQACHAVYREQDAATGAFRLKP